MELRQIRYFIAVCEEGQFVKAAQRLHITQSALSQQIQALEKFLGVHLFDSQKRKIQRVVVLTNAGSDFLTDAKKIIAQADKTVARFHNLAKNIQVIKLGTYNLLNKKEIIKTVEKINSQHPNAEFKIVQYTSPEEVQKALLDDQIDYGITILPLIASKKMHHFPLNQVKMCLLVHKKSILAKTNEVKLSSLNEEEWVEIDHKVHPVFKNIEDNCRKAGLLHRKIVQEVPTLDLLCHFVNMGKGIAFVPSYTDVSDYSNVILKEIKDDFIVLDQVLCFTDKNNLKLRFNQ